MTFPGALRQPEPARQLGANVLEDGRVSFRVWAPRCKEVAVVIGSDARTQVLKAADNGYFEAILDGVAPGARYEFLLDRSRLRLDPASRFQPDGVQDRWLLVVTPRLTAALTSPGQFPLGDIWQNTSVRLPEEAPSKWRNLFEPRTAHSGSGKSRELKVSELLQRFPLALLESA